MKIDMCNGKTTITDDNNTIVINGEDFTIETEGDMVQIKSDTILYERCGAHSTLKQLCIPLIKLNIPTMAKLNSDEISNIIKGPMKNGLGW